MLNVPLDDDNWPEVAQHLDGFAKEAAEVLDFKKAKGELPDWFATKFPLHTPEGEAGKYSPHNRRHTVDCAFDFALSLDNPSPPAPAKLEESPEKPSGPILVAPDQVVFKQALSVRRLQLDSSVAIVLTGGLLSCCPGHGAGATYECVSAEHYDERLPGGDRGAFRTD